MDEQIDRKKSFKGTQPSTLPKTNQGNFPIRVKILIFTKYGTPEIRITYIVTPALLV